MKIPRIAWGIIPVLLLTAYFLMGRNTVEPAEAGCAQNPFGCGQCIYSTCNLGPGQNTVFVAGEWKFYCMDYDNDGQYHCVKVWVNHYDIVESNIFGQYTVGSCTLTDCGGQAQPQLPCIPTNQGPP